MAYSVGIFRKISQRPHQRQIRTRWVVEPWTGPAPAVDTSLVIPHRQFRNPEPRFQRQPRTQIPLGVAAPIVPAPGWQEHLRLRAERYPKLLARERFDYKAAARSKYFEPPHVGVSPVPRPTFRRPARLHKKIRFKSQRLVFLPHTVGISAVPRPVFKRPVQVHRDKPSRVLRLKFISTLFVPPPVTAPGWNRRKLPQRQRAGRFIFRQMLQITKGVAAVVPGADIGWLVSWMTKRAYGHNIRR